MEDNRDEFEEFYSEPDFVPAEKLGEGWVWMKFDDGSGHLISPSGKEYMSYDLQTNEYEETNGSGYDRFPLNYYYADGIDPSKFNAFDFMEQKMLDVILPIERKKAELSDKCIKILETWLTDNGDMRCNAIIIQDNKEVANIIASYKKFELRQSIGNKDLEMDEEFIKRAFQTLIYNDIRSYLNLPKISSCSKLLQEIYDTVCYSDDSTCSITEDDWNYFYANNYSNNDIEVLKEEIKKYELNYLIYINIGEYKIIAYSALGTKFNDDRNLELNKENDLVI